MVKTLHFHWRGRGFSPWLGNLRSLMPLDAAKKKKKKKCEGRIELLSALKNLRKFNSQTPFPRKLPKDGL